MKFKNIGNTSFNLSSLEGVTKFEFINRYSKLGIDVEKAWQILKPLVNGLDEIIEESEKPNIGTDIKSKSRKRRSSKKSGATTEKPI